MKTSMKVVLGTVAFLSLSANMALAGVVAGENMGGGIAGKVASAFAAFADLSPESRDKTVEIVKKELPQIQDEIKDIHAKREEAKAILSRQDYKRADLEKVLADLRTDATRLQESGQTAVLDVVDALKPEERMNFMHTIEVNK